MKKAALLALMAASSAGLQAQQFLSSSSFREENKIDDNVGFFASLGVNATHSFISGEGYSRSAKGALSLLPAIGVFYQKGISENLSIRLSVMLGANNYAYKYAQPFDSLQAENFPVTSSEFSSYTRAKNSSAFVMPQLDLGYVLKPIKNMYLIEVRAGVGMHAYLSQRSDSGNISAIQNVSVPKQGVVKYFDCEQLNYGGSRKYGTFSGTIYVGMRWQKTFSNILNHSAIGIQAIVPINLDNAGYSEISYTATGTTNYLLGKEQVKMGLMSFGIRYTYSIL